jgi:CRP/FNR family cyclic AMP-dependent transcriptional regulator
VSEIQCGWELGPLPAADDSIRANLLEWFNYCWKNRINPWQNPKKDIPTRHSGVHMASLRRLSKRGRHAHRPTTAFDPQTFLAKAGTGRTVHRYGPKKEIFSQGEPATDVFYIQNGAVKLSVVSEQGKEAMIALLGPNDFLGEGCIATDHPVRMATATAITECSLLKIEKQEMLRTLRGEQQFSDLFVAYVVQRHNQTQADLVDQLFNSSEKRLARTLLVLTRFGKQGWSEEVTPRVGQETLAEMIGTTRSRVNYFMNKFRKLGFIEYNGGLKVHSSLLSVVLHE